MPTTEVSVAVVALLVALIALLVTVSQLTGQIFSTAEGVRKCSRSVICHWSTLNRWKWFWSEWRFEIKFASPDLRLGVPYKLSPLTTITSAIEDPSHLAAGETHNEKGIGSSEQILGLDDHAMAPFKLPQQSEGWVALLSAINNMASRYQVKDLRWSESRDNISWPGIRIRYRSWDGMPADVTGPIATTTLGDIAIIARRMGMSWKTFDPDKSALSAEGGGHSLTSVEIRALGLSLRYLSGHRQYPYLNLAGEPDNSKSGGVGAENHIWSREADIFMFGIFPGDKALGLKNFNVNTDGDIRRLMNEVFALKDYPNALDWTQYFPSKTWLERYEINELRTIACPMLRQRGSTVISLRYPKYGADIWFFQPARTGFRYFVSERLKLQSSTHLQGLLSKFPIRKYSELERLELHHDGHDFTTKYFQGLNSKYDTFYWDLLRAHFSVAPLCSWESRQKVRRRKEPPRNAHLGFGANQHAFRAEQVTMLWESIPNVVSFMQSANAAYTDKTEIEEAWITLWFRAVCWASCHRQVYLDPAEDFLPAQWYGSQLPVYLL